MCVCVCVSVSVCVCVLCVCEVEGGDIRLPLTVCLLQMPQSTRTEQMLEFHKQEQDNLLHEM